MNPENPTPREQLEARLTALLLGELPADEADALRVEIAHYPELRSLCNRLQQTIELVRETACEPAPQADVPPAPLRLSEAKREQLLAQFKTVQPKEFAQPKRPTWLIQVAEISAAAAAILLVASLSVPNFVRSRTTSQANAVINNLRQLDGAKQQWALENKAPATAEPTMAQIQPYMGRGSGGTLPGPVMGETYMLGDLSTSPSAEIDASKKPGLLSRLFVAPPENGAGRKRLTLDEDRWRDVPQEQVSTLTTTPASGDASREAATRALDGIQPPQVIGAVVLPAPKTAKAAAVAPALAPAPVALAASPPRANIVLPSSGEQADDLTSREINVSAGGIAQNSLGMNAEVAARDRSVAGNRSAQDSFNLDSVKIPLQANNSFDNSDFSNGLARDDVGALRYSANKDDDGFFLYKPVQGDFSIVDQNRAGTTGTAGGRGGGVDSAFSATDLSGIAQSTPKPGDPEWAGVLNKPDSAHSASNVFVGRYASIALPTTGASDVAIDLFTNRGTMKSANMDLAAAQTPTLVHRWSLNGPLTDAIGKPVETPAENEQLVTRTLKVDPNSVGQGLEGVVGSSIGNNGGRGFGGGGGFGGGLSDGSVQQSSSSGFRGMGGGSNLVVFPGSTESDVEKVQPAQQQAQQSGGNFGSGVPAANALVPPATPLTSTNGIISRDPYLIAGTQPGVRFPIRSQPISIDNIDIQNFTNRGTTRDYPNATPLGSSQITYDPETHQLVVVTDDKAVSNLDQILENLERPKEANFDRVALGANVSGVQNEARQTDASGKLTETALTPGSAVIPVRTANPAQIAGALNTLTITPSSATTAAERPPPAPPRGGQAVTFANTLGSANKGVYSSDTLQQQVAEQRNNEATARNREIAQAPDANQLTAMDEAVRRQASAVRLRMVLSEAQNAKQQNDLETAAKKYEESYALMQRVGRAAVEQESAQLVNGRAEVLMELAKQDQKEGRYMQAEGKMNLVLNANPQDKDAMNFEKQNMKLLESQMGKIPSADVAEKSVVSNDRRVNALALVEEGRMLLEQGRPGQAEASLKEAIANDPSNQEAAQYLRLVAEKRAAGETIRNEIASGKLLAQTLPPPNSFNRTNMVYTGKGRQDILAKLDKIHVDDVKYPEVELKDVVAKLAEVSKSRDPDKKGINFFINNPNPQTMAIDPTTQLPIAPVDISKTKIRVNLDNVRLADVLDAITKTADFPIKYSVLDYAVVFSAKDDDTVGDQQPAAQPAKPKEQEPPPPRKPAGPAPVPQPEVATRENAFSTFSLNVSDVSFKLAGASLDQGMMPDPASIRSEEFINAFDYRDPEPPAGARVAFAWERARYPFAQNRDVLRFSIKTAALGRQRGRPMNIVLLLDKSGSMERADRVRIVQEALRVLAAQLGPQDRVSVVTFARTARLWVDGIPGNTAGEVLDQAGGLTPEGGTNLEDAMNLAYATALRHYMANGVNRVVLLTDGAANLGDVDPESLKQKVETHRKQGIALDCFGIGWEGFNDDLLEVLSRHGDGRYGFINTPEEAAEGFAAQLAGALRVAAADVKVQVEFNPKRVTAYRQIGYAKHQLTKEQFRDNTVDAAEIGAAEAGNALYTVEVNPAGEGPLATVRVRYKVPETGDFREQAWTVPCSGNAMALEDCGATIRLAATSSAFSEWLAQSPFAQEVTPDRLLTYLNGVPEIYGADARPKKLEAMIRQAKAISGK